MVTDTISDMLTRIRNANMVKHQIVQVPSTKMSNAIAMILKEEGFVENFEIYKDENSFSYLLISLKYKGKDSFQTYVGGMLSLITYILMGFITANLLV